MNSIEEFDEDAVRPSQKKRILAISALLIMIATAFASNNVLTNGRVEFGQGVYTVSACDYSLLISATAGSGDQIFGTGTVSSGDGTYPSTDYIKDVDIAQFTPSKCAGKTLTIKFFGSSGNTPLPIFLHKFGYNFASCEDPNHYLSGAPGSNACDGKPANQYNSGIETRWLSAWGYTQHHLRITFDTDTALSHIGVWNGDDDQDNANLTNRKLAQIQLCPTAAPNATFTNWMCYVPYIEGATNYGVFSSMTNPTSIGGQYPGRFGPYFPDTKSKYWELIAYDYGRQRNAAQDAYNCPAYTSGGSNGQCSQVGEIQFFSSSDKIILKVSNSNQITVQNGIGGSVAFTNNCSSLSQSTLTGGFGNFPTKDEASSAPEIGVCQDASGTYKIRFAYPTLKIAQVSIVTIETSPTAA